MKFKINIILIVVFLSTLQGFSQEVLTKKEALAITLENNFGIKIANNNIEVAENNASIYNSGFLPTASISSGANYSNNNQTVTSQDGESKSTTGAVTKSYNASLNLNYTIFDGLGRKYNYQQLKEQYNLSELQAKETIENTYLQLFTVYFQIARLSENKANLNQALTISKRRLIRAKYQYEYGQTTRLELLNAEVDVNNDSITFINANQQLSNAKRGLNIILGTNKDVNYSVETEVDFNKMMNIKDLQQKTMANNSLLKQNEKNIAISEFNIKINKASGTWTVRAGGAVLAESKNALELKEGDYPVMIYFPRDDIAMALLDDSPKSSHCPHKGDASYYSIVTKSRTIENAAWSYESPNESVAKIKGHLAFYAGDDVAVERV